MAIATNLGPFLLPKFLVNNRRPQLETSTLGAPKQRCASSSHLLNRRFNARNKVVRCRAIMNKYKTISSTSSNSQYNHNTNILRLKVSNSKPSSKVLFPKHKIIISQGDLCNSCGINRKMLKCHKTNFCRTQTSTSFKKRMADGRTFNSYMNINYPNSASIITSNETSRGVFQTSTKDVHKPLNPLLTGVGLPSFGISPAFLINPAPPLWFPSCLPPNINFLSHAPIFGLNLDRDNLNYWQHVMGASMINNPLVTMARSKEKDRPPLVQESPKHQCTGCGLYFKYLANLTAHKEYYCSKCNVNFVGDTPINAYMRTNKNFKALARDYRQSPPTCKPFNNNAIQNKNLIPPKSNTPSQNQEAAQLKPGLMHQPKRDHRDLNDQDGTFCAVCDIKFIKRTSYQAHKDYYCTRKNVT